MKHPIQPLETIDDVVRFKRNAIVDALLDHGQKTGLGLNELAAGKAGTFSNEDWQQLAQLIGYSLSGYSELSYVDDDAYGAAEIVATDGLTPDAARVLHLERELSALREYMRAPVARLYGVHPDDLKKNP